MVTARWPWLLGCLALGLAACGQRERERPRTEAEAAAEAAANAASEAPPKPATPPAAVQLAPAPPVPEVPAGLPEPPRPHGASAEVLALGAALFAEKSWSADGKVACQSCHDPAADYSGGREPTSLGRENLRRAPALGNLAWQRELGWDGRFSDGREHLRAHLWGQLGLPLPDAVAKLAEHELLRAHFLRAHGKPPEAELALEALLAFALTRYSGGAPWDLEERLAEPSAAGRALRAGYALFLGKARCGQCHPPPLYTDFGYHRLGLIGTADEGRGLVDRAELGKFKTPSLRGAAARKRFFHDGSATSLAAAIDWHLAGGVGLGADRSIIDPELVPVQLTADERAQLDAFVAALTPAAAP